MSDLLDWLDLFDLKQKRLVHSEDEGIRSAVPPQFTHSGALIADHHRLAL